MQTAEIQSFDAHPGFIELDNRRDRWNCPITKEIQEKKHMAILPPYLVEGKRVLDLGSGIGATGQWCLFHGAAYYEGVEFQSEYVRLAETLLAHHDNKRIVEDSVESYLARATDEFDIVIFGGILQVYVDFLAVVRKAAALAKEYIVFDNQYPHFALAHSEHASRMYVEYSYETALTLPDGNNLMGIGSRLTPSALMLIMEHLGFITDGGVIRPEVSLSSKDPYNSPEATTLPFKYLIRFMRGGSRLASLSENLTKHQGRVCSAAKKENIKRWEFNEYKAKEFHYIARTSIPNYYAVLDKCLQVVKKRYGSSQPKIIDVGSALGLMLARLHQNGYRNLWGIDDSLPMLQKSFRLANLIYGDKFPVEEAPFDVVIMNWTLHFIEDKRSYLLDVYNSLAEDGIFILSDKLLSSSFSHDLYYDFKRNNGLSEMEIREKAEQLKGYMHLDTLEWYLATLREIGFATVDVIDASYSFVTLMISKQ